MRYGMRSLWRHQTIVIRNPPIQIHRTKMTPTFHTVAAGRAQTATTKHLIRRRESQNNRRTLAKASKEAKRLLFQWTSILIQNLITLEALTVVIALPWMRLHEAPLNLYTIQMLFFRLIRQKTTRNRNEKEQSRRKERLLAAIRKEKVINFAWMSVFI